MDFGNAALMTSTFFALVEITKQLWPEIKKDPRLLGGAIVVYSQLVPHGIAHSDWGETQIIGGLTIDTMNAFSLSAVGVGLAGFAMIAYKFVAAIPSIGENQPPDPP